MIKKHGTVTITENQLLVEGFTFEGVNLWEGQIEAIDWAARLLAEARRQSQERTVIHDGPA